jgi:hypothetical protein
VFNVLFHNQWRAVLLVFLLSMSFAHGQSAVTSSSNARPAEVAVSSPPSPGWPTKEENRKQRVLLASLMVALLGGAAWRQWRRRL